MGLKGQIVEVPLGWAAAVVGHGPAPAAQPPGEILVLRSNDLGDLLTTTPIFEALRGRFPDSKIVAGIGTWGRPILENNPFVDEIIEIDVPWNNKFVADKSWRAVADFLLRSEQVGRLRRRGGFDVAIDVMGSHVGAVLLMRVGARYRVGVRGYRGGWSACQKYIQFSRRQHVAQAALDQAALLGAKDLPEARPQIYLTQAERDEASRIWASNFSRPGIRMVVGAGAGLKEKCCPTDILSTALSSASREMPLNVLIVGSASDGYAGTEIAARSVANVRSVCGTTSLRVCFALVEQSDFVLTSPSMLLHAAAAFRRPTLAIVGGSYPDVDAHDQLWGYPTPYASIGPATKQSGSWPGAEQIAVAITKMLGAAVQTSTKGSASISANFSSIVRPLFVQ